MALSRYYNPYYNPRAAGAGMAAFMFRQPEEQIQQSGQYYLPDRRRQTNIDYAPPQQNEVFYPQQPEQVPEAPVAVNFPTEPTELAEPTEKAELIPTTVKAVVPELVEPEVEEIEEPAPKSKKGVVSRKKQVKRPVDDDDEDDYAPKMPSGAFFPMFFGWGGRSGASGPGAPGGPTAIANAYSTGRGGVATSHATAYGAPRPESQYIEDRYKKN